MSEIGGGSNSMNCSAQSRLPEASGGEQGQNGCFAEKKEEEDESKPKKGSAQSAEDEQTGLRTGSERSHGRAGRYSPGVCKNSGSAA